MLNREGLGNRALLIVAMRGLGDAVYQRPFFRAAGSVGDVYVDTPWPEMYDDLPGVHPVKPANMPYRTQRKNMDRLAGYPWSVPPRNVRRIQMSYALIRPGSICAELETKLGLSGRPFVFDLPDFGPPPALVKNTHGRPIAVVRPVTIREEWKNVARAPRPEYIAAAAVALRAAGYHVVVVADIDPPAEYLEGQLPVGDDYFVRGELAAREVVALIQSAAVVVGGSGFIIPITIAAGTGLIVISGGQGGHNAPERVTDPRMDLRRVQFVTPDRFCMCTNHRHACDKRISNFDRRFARALSDATQPVPV